MPSSNCCQCIEIHTDSLQQKTFRISERLAVTSVKHFNIKTLCGISFSRFNGNVILALINFGVHDIPLL